MAFELDREQCTADADCQRADFSGVCRDNVCMAQPVDPAWACLGDFEPPTVPEGETRTHRLRFELATEAGVPPMGLSIELCSALDAGCSNPVPGVPQPDDEGRVELDVDPGFRGFLEVTSDETVPALVHLQSPVRLPMKENLIRVIGPGEFEALAQAAGFEVDPTRGTAVVLTDNCFDERAPGVTISSVDVDEDTVPFYFAEAFPDPEGTQTDAQGAAGFFNLEPKIVTVETHRAKTDAFIGRASLTIRKEHITYSAIGPTEE